MYVTQPSLHHDKNKSWTYQNINMFIEIIKEKILGEHFSFDWLDYSTSSCTFMEQKIKRNNSNRIYGFYLRWLKYNILQ